METVLYALADLSAVCVSAMSGATAARQRNLDVFGVLTLGYLTALAGGIFRDLCIGALPPVGISDWRYLMAALLGSAIAISASDRIDRLERPVGFVDAFALGFYAVTGATKALSFGQNALTAVLLGTATAIGGGVVRDVLLNRVPGVLQKEIYALAAVAGTIVQVLGTRWSLSPLLTTSLAATTCITIRLMAMRHGWQFALPRLNRQQPQDSTEDRDAER